LFLQHPADYGYFVDAWREEWREGNWEFWDGDWIFNTSLALLLHKRDIDSKEHKIRSICWRIYEDPYNSLERAERKPDSGDVLLQMFSVHLYWDEYLGDIGLGEGYINILG
jgi:hypothetical protein